MPQTLEVFSVCQNVSIGAPVLFRRQITTHPSDHLYSALPVVWYPCFSLNIARSLSWVFNVIHFLKYYSVASDNNPILKWLKQERIDWLMICSCWFQLILKEDLKKHHQKPVPLFSSHLLFPWVGSYMRESLLSWQMASTLQLHKSKSIRFGDA